jgi:hypothetical protein
MVSLADVDR